MGLYEFADNSPMDFTDPMGKGPIKIAKKIIEYIAKRAEKAKEIRRQAWKEQKKRWEKEVYELPDVKKGKKYPTELNEGYIVPGQTCPPKVNPKDPSTKLPPENYIGGFIAGIGWWDVLSTLDPTGATDVIDALGWVAENYTPEEKKTEVPFDMHGSQPLYK
ncbi:MAG: hypothetical protein AB1442_09790 [Nitrospirota bacterium]